MTKKVTISFKVAPDLKAVLRKLAQDDGRSLSQYIDRALTSHAAGAQSRKSGMKRGTK